MTTDARTIAGLLIAALGLALPAPGATLEAPPAPAAAGFIHGTVTTTAGNQYTGVIRWGNEEAFWDDLFHSSKEELPYAHLAAEELREHGRRGEEWWRAFGRTLHLVWDDAAGGRIFIARFGDIATLRVLGPRSAELTMRCGASFEVSGYANDVGATLVVQDGSVGEIEVPWKKISTVEFSAAPPALEVNARRLRGVVHTDAGELDGFIQWDSQEALTSDLLDGDTDDGRVSLEMGKLRAIERRSRRSATVTLADGRTMVLSGTNDVNDSIRGILVEDPRYGRVKVPWSAFGRLELLEPAGSGRGFDDYDGGAPLEGTVTTVDGVRHAGRLVFDVDESWSWEMLNGSAFDVEYTIPFELVAAIEPRGSSAATVTLVSGETLRLEDSQDVSENNGGVVVLAEGREKYLPWRTVQKIELGHR